VAELAAQAVHDPDREVRIALAHAAGSLGPRARSILARLSQDGDLTVRHAAETALARLP
jgi:hypothetical protein